MNAIIGVRRTLPLVQQIYFRNFNQTAVLRAEERPSGFFKRLKRNQKKFQKDDGIPVYLKGGVFDKILFQLSLIGTIVGFTLSWYTFAVIAMK